MHGAVGCGGGGAQRVFSLQITSVLLINADNVASGGKFHNCFDGFTPVAHKDGAGQPPARLQGCRTDVHLTAREAADR